MNGYWDYKNVRFKDELKEAKEKKIDYNIIWYLLWRLIWKQSKIKIGINKWIVIGIIIWYLLYENIIWYLFVLWF